MHLIKSCIKRCMSCSATATTTISSNLFNKSNDINGIGSNGLAMLGQPTPRTHPHILKENESKSYIIMLLY